MFVPFHFEVLKGVFQLQVLNFTFYHLVENHDTQRDVCLGCSDQKITPTIPQNMQMYKHTHTHEGHVFDQEVTFRLIEVPFPTVYSNLNSTPSFGLRTKKNKRHLNSQHTLSHLQGSHSEDYFQYSNTRGQYPPGKDFQVYFDSQQRMFFCHHHPKRSIQAESDSHHCHHVFHMKDSCQVFPHILHSHNDHLWSSYYCHCMVGYCCWSICNDHCCYNPNRINKPIEICIL